VVMTLNLVATILFTLLSYLSTWYEPDRTLAVQLYAAAAVGTFGFAIYTRVMMWDVNGKLQDKVAAAKKVKTDMILQGDEDLETHHLVQEWGTLNMYRGLLPLLSALVGVWAMVSHI
jgi:hypothetical protein